MRPRSCHRALATALLSNLPYLTPLLAYFKSFGARPPAYIDHQNQNREEAQKQLRNTSLIPLEPVLVGENSD